MPSTFDDFGIHFLYPDNWIIQSRDSDDVSDTVTLELPRGGFFAVTKYRESPPLDVVMEKIVSAMKAEYPELEAEEIGDVDDDDSEAVEMRFYYLDLLIVARVRVLVVSGVTLAVQIQAESREFDAGEPVFAAMLKSICDGIASDDA
jgi:hypothetical protein